MDNKETRPDRTADDNSVERNDACDFAVNIGLYSNVFLALLKTAVGIVGHSAALLADGINSTSDFVYYVAVKIFMRLSRMPPDDEHPYGHSQFETIAALVVGAFIITTGVAIFWESADRGYHLYKGAVEASEISIYALWTALFTIALKIGLAVKTRKIGAQTRNPVVSALAKDHLNDIMASSAAAVGILLALFGYSWVDPFAGAIVSLFILKTGVGILKDAAMELMDTVPGRELDADIRAALAGVQGIKAVEEVRAHRFGPHFIVNVTLCVEGDIPVTRGDEIATQAETTLCARFHYIRKVYVHYHPGAPASPCENAKISQ
ncbi:MAG: cation diffusion facilitator family transporter [Elusimicrobiales bacterium]|nr:cation diffusion facilitator family transporter [Elusimicrobiales bacterium]